MTTRKSIRFLFVTFLFVGLGFYLYSGGPQLFGQPKEEGSNKQTESAMIQNNQKAIERDKDVQIVAVGDSLTQGVGDSQKAGGYVHVLQNKLRANDYRATLHNFGKAGDRTDQLLKKIETPEIKNEIKQADIVLITIGANDIMKVLRDHITNIDFIHFEAEKPNFSERLNEIFKTLRKDNPDAEIYLLGFYNPFKQYFSDIQELEQIVNEWNTVGQNQILQYDNMYYIPIKDLFDHASENLFYEDNFHPNDAGYEQIAKRVYERITK